MNSEERFQKKMTECQKSDDQFAHDFGGLRTFMMEDQAEVLKARGLSKREYNEVADGLAKGMMIMGKALTKFVAKYFPADEYFRLSIHCHPFDGKKFTVLLLPTVIRANKEDEHFCSWYGDALAHSSLLQQHGWHDELHGSQGHQEK